MTKQMFILSVLLLTAYTTTNGQFSVGVKGGITSNDVNANLYIDAVNNAPKGYNSAVYGLTAEVPIYQNLSLVSELLSTKKGFVVDEGTSFNVLGLDIPIGGRVSTSLNYVESPLLLKASVGSPTFKAYGIMGPSIGYATSATLQPSVSLLIDFNLPAVNIDLSNSMYNRWEVSAVLGGGAQIQVGQGKIFADVRYQHGLKDMINSSIVELDLKNRGIQVSAGYAFTF